MGVFLMACQIGHFVPSPPPPGPTVTSVVTSRGNAGICSGNVCTLSANATTSVTTMNANDSLYTLNLYENGVQVTPGFTTSGGSYGKTFTGYAAAGGSPYINPSLQYRVDIVLNSTGQVTSTLTGNSYSDTFGTCGGPK